MDAARFAMDYTRPAIAQPATDSRRSGEAPDTEKQLLLVVPDAAEAAELCAHIASADYGLTTLADGRAALDQIVSQPLDLVVMDCDLPLLDGHDVLARLRAAGMTLPIILLINRHSPVTIAAGLNAGADDVVIKPVDPEVLKARIHALLRARSWDARTGAVLRAGDITISPNKFRAWRNGRAINLPKVEFHLLMEFARQPDSVLTRPMLIQRVWHSEAEPGSNIVDAYIKRLRKRLMEHGGDDPIVTVRGVGYRLRD